MNKRKTKVDVNHDLYSEEDFLKDCPNSPFVPTILPAQKRVIAIGDIHGDLDLAIKSFKIANLIDDDYNWIADPPNTVVIQVGDQIDSCRPIPDVFDCRLKKQTGDKAEDMKVINFFNTVSKNAAKKGGAVYSLLGNHELMNAQGRFGYVSYENYYNFDYTSKDGENYSGPQGRKESFQPGGPISKMLACTRNSVMVIGSNLFVHAGILPVLVERLDHLDIDNPTKLKYLNSVIRKWLLKKLSNNQDIVNKTMFMDDIKLSPFWTRVYGIIPENTDLETGDCYSAVKKILQVYKIGHIVVGHTPQLFANGDGINGTCYEKGSDNKLYRVDGGFSKAFKVFGNHDMTQVLEIIDDNIFNIIRDKEIHPYSPAPEVDINEQQMQKIAKIYSQNRVKTGTTENSEINKTSDGSEANKVGGEKIKKKKQKKAITNYRFYW